MRQLPASVILALFSLAATAAEDTRLMPQLDQYNVVWTRQSKDSSESMPVGGHDIALNVWVENDGLLLYVHRAG